MVRPLKALLGAAVVAAAGLAVPASAPAAPHDFHPDGQLGTSQAQWRSLGQADWKLDHGEIVGTARAGGGLLLLGSPLQDVQLATAFRCASQCAAGLLLRVEDTPTGTQGVLVSLAPGDTSLYRVTFDKAGHELTRERLKAAPGNRRFASITADNVQQPGAAARAAQAAAGGGAAAPGGGPGAAPRAPAAARPAATPRAPVAAGDGEGAGAAGGGPPASGPAPTAPPAAGPGGPRRPAAAVKIGDWNEVESIVDADILRAKLNGIDIPPGDTADAATGFGPVGLYVASGEVHFRAVDYKDLRLKGWGPEYLAKGYRVQQVTPFSYSYGVDVADVNHDGVLDIVSGPFYYLGPDFTKAREIYPSETLNPGTVAPVASRMQVVYDFTGDGWPDVLRISPLGGALYVNPKGESRHWTRYEVLSVTTEMVLFKDIDGDGRPEVIFGGGGIYAYAKPDPANPTGKWIIHPISQGVPVAIHGLGMGDVNRDGRMDLVVPAGWFEQPPAGTPGPWTYHPAKFGGGGAEMCVYDINGDGRTDVVTSLEAHGWGLSWFEQQADGSFTEHPIMGDFSTKNAGGVTFSELHGGACADMDHDGIPDLITGKRYWSHVENYSGPDPYGPPVLYVYKTRRNRSAPGGAEFVPELISNRTGVGSNMVVKDINGDGKTDIVVASVLGVTIFWGEKSAAAKPRPRASR